MTDPGNRSFQYETSASAPKQPNGKMTQSGDDLPIEPFYPTIPPPPEAARQPPQHNIFQPQPHPDFSSLQSSAFPAAPMLQVDNPNLVYAPSHSSASNQPQPPPFRPVPQEAQQDDSNPSGSRIWKAGASHTFASDSRDGGTSGPSNSHDAQSSSEAESSQNPSTLPIARAQQKGSTYIARVDRQHIGEAEHEQYKSKYAAEVRGLRSRIDDLWGGSAWFTQQIVPGYGRAGSHDRVLYTIQQLARGSAGEGGEGGTYPERVRQAIEDAVHARLAEENKNRKSKRENLNLRAVVTTNDFKAAAKALGCVSLRMPAGQPRKPRQPKQGSKAGAGGASTSKGSATSDSNNGNGSNNSASPSQSQNGAGEGSNWMQPASLNGVANEPSTSHHHHHHNHHPVPIDYASQVGPPPLPSNEDEIRANRAAFFAKYEADSSRKPSPSSHHSLQQTFHPNVGLQMHGGSSPSAPSNPSASSSRPFFSNPTAPQFGNYGQANSWMGGSRDSNERWAGNQLSNSNTPQFNHSLPERESAYHPVGIARRSSLELDGSQIGRESYQHPSANNGGMGPTSPSMYANSIHHGMVSTSNQIQNQSNQLRSLASPSMSHPAASLASHSLSQMSSPQMRNMNQGESSLSNGRALPPLPSLSLPPMASGGNSLPPLNWNLHHRKRGNEEEPLPDDLRDPKRRLGNQFQATAPPADSLHFA